MMFEQHHKSFETDKTALSNLHSILEQPLLKVNLVSIIDPDLELNFQLLPILKLRNQHLALNILLYEPLKPEYHICRKNPQMFRIVSKQWTENKEKQQRSPLWK